MNIKTIALIVASCILVACNSNKDKKKSFQRFKIDKINYCTWANLINVDQLFMLQSEQPLSMATKCLVGNREIVFWDYKLKSVFLFDTEGNYISNVGRRGNSQSEYTDISDIAYNKDSTIIKILDRKGILNYSARDGHFISFESLESQNYNFGKFIPVDDGHYLFFDLSNDYSIIDYRQEEKSLVVKGLRKNDRFQFCSEHFYRYRGDIRVFSDYGNFYIDSYENGRLSKMFEFDLGSLALPPSKKPYNYENFKKIDENPNYFKCIERIQESDTWLYLNIMGPNQTFYDVLLNKQTSGVFAGKSDMDTALTIIGTENEDFWALLYPDLIKENSYLYHKICDFIQNGQRNPILVKVKIINKE